jgi:glucokinase-like ROK family protein
MEKPDQLRTGDQFLVREINLSLIMHQLHKHAPISRATLAEITGLNKTTVSSLVNELTEHQFIHEVGYDTSGVGRPAILLALNPEAGCIVSCEIGVDFIAAIVSNFAAEILWKHREDISSDLGQQAILERALAVLRDMANKAQATSGLLGLTVGVPGLVDHETGRLLFAPNLDWHDVALGDILRDKFDVPVFVDNEANMAALGEQIFGAAQGYDEVLYISVGVGLGGGIVRQGSLFRGRAGFAGEFGHMTMIPDGELCNCGNRGCWETVVSQSALLRFVRQFIKEEGQKSILSEQTGADLDQLTVPMVAEAARKGDQVARKAFDLVAHYLGIGIANLVNALNPDLVVLGGIVSSASDLMLPTVWQEIKDRALRWNVDAVEVVLANHGQEACLMGGIATVYQSILRQPGNVAK